MKSIKEMQEELEKKKKEIWVIDNSLKMLEKCKVLISEVIDEWYDYDIAGNTINDDNIRRLKQNLGLDGDGA